MSSKQAPSSTSSFRSILKSSSLIGGASAINILIAMVRVKFVAVLLGPGGVGLLGMYAQISNLISTLTGMGIGSSGVRQVAESVGSHDDARIARTVITLRRTAWLTGGLGMLVMVIFSVPLSMMTFGTSDYATSIALLGITLLSGAIATGQGCIINGNRRIADLAKISIISAINGTLISIPCFYLLGQSGIVPSLILSALAVLATSWWFARRVPVKDVILPWRESYAEASQLLVLGISFMAAGLFVTLSNYLIRAIVLRQFDLADVGIYQAAFNLSGMLVGFVLGAMGADYYPRLTAVAHDNDNVHRMVNEQSQISILLALPGLLVMMIFAPLIIKLFYTDSFVTAVPIMRWCVIGILGQVFSWPLGMVILAKGKGKLFFATEAFVSVLHVVTVFYFIQVWGLEGAGMAFMLMYIVHAGLMLFVMRRLVGRNWTQDTAVMALIAAIVMALVMLNCNFNSDISIKWVINLAALCIVSVTCVYHLSKKSGVGLAAFVSLLKARFRLNSNK